MAQFIGTSMLRGFEGDITRGAFDYTTEIKANDADAPVQAFGIAVKLNATADAVTPCDDDADAVYGISVREYHQEGNPLNLVTVLKRGYIAVKPKAGTPALGGAVYLDADGLISADSTGAVLIANAQWMGAKDADGLAELAFNI